MSHMPVQPLEILAELGIKEPIVSPVQGGFALSLWKIEYQGEVYALRVFQWGAYEQWDREQMVMRTALAAGLPVPEIVQAGSWHHYPVLLLTWLRGRTMADELQARPWNIWHLGVIFGRMQVAIHNVPAPSYLCDQPDAWISWQCEKEPTLQGRLRTVRSAIPALLHLDYHLLNVLTDGKQITGVIDWANACAGDPRADAARTASILRVDPLTRRPFLRWIGLRLFERAWYIGYRSAGGDVSELPLFYAWAGICLQHDLAPRYTHSPQELEPARRWTQKWLDLIHQL